MAIKLHAEISGDNEASTIIIIHGLFGSTSNWRTVSRELSKSHRIICLDLRNHGNSPWHDSMSYTEMAGDVKRFIDDNQITRPSIIGHSMGGKTTMALLQDFELDLAKIFIIDIAPVTYAHSHDGFINAMQSLNFDTVKNRNDVDQHLKPFVEEPPIRQFLMQNLHRQSDSYKWRININAIASNMTKILGYGQRKSVDHPVIFISGGQSTYIQPEHHSLIKANFPDAVIETIADAGHWLHAEKPAEFLAIVNKYLS
jgi:esterase